MHHHDFFSIDKKRETYALPFAQFKETVLRQLEKKKFMKGNYFNEEEYFIDDIINEFL